MLKTFLKSDDNTFYLECGCGNPLQSGETTDNCPYYGRRGADPNTDFWVWSVENNPGPSVPRTALFQGKN